MSDRYFPIPVVYINGVPQGVRRYDDEGQRMDDSQPGADPVCPTCGDIAACEHLTPAVSAPEGGRPIEFNINDCVWVKLTAHGRAHLNAKWPPYQTKIEQPDGWSKWQLWHLMEAFGDALYLGCQMPFETVIRIPQPEPASPSRAALLALVEQWRSRADGCARMFLRPQATLLQQVADELAALLTSEPSENKP